jgi:ATP-dependent Clp protease ATP-binding subunit ClpC
VKPARDRSPETEPTVQFEGRLKKRARGLEKRLARRVLGQDRAVRAVARAVERAAAGLAMPGRPLATFLFLGRTGTGKTSLAKALAREVFGDEGRSLVRVDCGEYALPHEHARLIGSPPGFVGHEDGGHLTRALHENPSRVVLFDEIEKAHSRMHGVLLSILEEGALTDGRGRRVRFDRTIVVLTSNEGAMEMAAAARSVGFQRETLLGPERLSSIALEALVRRFSPEFLGRVDETIVFEELDLARVELIARGQLFDLALRSRRAGLAVAFPAEIARWIGERSFSPEHGAREVARAIRREVEAPLSRLLLEGVPDGTALARARVVDDRVAFAFEP